MQQLSDAELVRRAQKDESEAIWANAVLGEVALLTAEFDKAKTFFRRAATDPNVSVTQLAVWLSQDE